MRPHIICQMVTSIDGRLHPSRYTVPPAGVSRDVLRGHSDRIYDLLGVDGWMIGRRTMSEMSKGTPPTVKDAPTVPRTTHVGTVHGRKLAVAVDPSGRVRYGSDNILDDHVVAVLGERSPISIWRSCARPARRTYSRARKATISAAPWKNSHRPSA